jgi:predicted Fe-S protein YdhL (DUF1289 family)
MADRIQGAGAHGATLPSMNAFAPSPSPPVTPCIGVCKLDAQGFCLGCRRTLDEIARWGAMSDAERLRCMREVLPGRTPAG